MRRTNTKITGFEHAWTVKESHANSLPSNQEELVETIKRVWEMHRNNSVCRTLQPDISDNNINNTK